MGKDEAAKKAPDTTKAAPTGGAPTPSSSGGGHKPATMSNAGGKGKGAPEAAPGMCKATSVGCKAKATRFDFCEEHYDQFKFGLIKKTGEMVPDHEKKIEHYMAYKKRMGAQKAA